MFNFRKLFALALGIATLFASAVAGPNHAQRDVNDAGALTVPANPADDAWAPVKFGQNSLNQTTRDDVSPTPSTRLGARSVDYCYSDFTFANGDILSSAD
ncbi:hypothetical protein B0H63DRAFT_529523 [Podospora didyma]|uniref:Uncharacterized protein n=1 Tax=Podospora didyma TaxID=330526 RepID=A0AAE0K181_9PEZI|nr:hypothetical protein B0H63DRAFT_529523 [Podospora didyma]